MQAILYHGNIDLDFPNLRIRRSAKDLDEISQTFQRVDPTSIRPGQRWPEKEGFWITEAAEEEEVPGECYLIEARGKGLLEAVKQVEWVTTQSEEGFDSAQGRWLTRTPNLYPLGSSPRGLKQMFCVERNEEEHVEVPGVFVVSCTYRGMLKPKAVKVRVGIAGREISRDQLINNLPGGVSGEPLKWNFAWPRPTLTLSFISTVIPTNNVPQQTTGAPSEYAPVVVEVPFTAIDASYNWPNGWTKAGAEVDIIPNKTLCFVQETWVYNSKVTL